jgi:hypothetical protein
MMPVYKGKRTPLPHRQTQTRHCWMLRLLRVMLLRHWQMPLPHKQMRTKRCWMPPPPLPLPDLRYLTLLTLLLVTSLLEQGQAPTLL